MKGTIGIATVLCALCAASGAAAAPGADSLSGDEMRRVVRHVDELYRSRSSSSTVEMEIVTPHWTRTLRMNAWSKGMNETFIRILEPKKEQGVATLRIGNEMWNYLPRTDKVIKIPPSMMMSSWMGSDFTNDDLVKEFSLIDDYTWREASVSDPDPSLIYIEGIPKPGLPIVWGSVVIAVRRTDTIPVWQEYFDEHGGLMRKLEFKDVKTMGGRTLPVELTMVPTDEEGHRTTIRYLDIEFDAEVPDEVFSLRNLRTRK